MFSEYHDDYLLLMPIKDARSDGDAPEQQVLKNACVQLKLGVGTDGPSHC